MTPLTGATHRWMKKFKERKISIRDRPYSERQSGFSEDSRVGFKDGTNAWLVMKTILHINLGIEDEET